MKTEYTKQAREFLEPMEGTGARAVWLSWIEVLEQDAESYSIGELRLIKRSLSRVRTVMTMTKGKTDEEKLSAIELIINSAKGVQKSREARRKQP